jgi:hypothetical protein
VDRPEACVLGTDRDGRTWRGRCWYGAARDHAPFPIEEELERRRFWAR